MVLKPGGTCEKRVLNELLALNLTGIPSPDPVVELLLHHFARNNTFGETRPIPTVRMNE